jgi:hypothetical protein
VLAPGIEPAPQIADIGKAMFEEHVRRTGAGSLAQSRAVRYDERIALQLLGVRLELV